MVETSGGGKFSIESKVVVTPDEGMWKGEVTPPGVIVRGQTREEVLRLASDATDAMVMSFFQGPDPLTTMKAYLDHHRVEYTIDEQSYATAQLSSPGSAQFQAERLAMSREYQFA